MHSHNNLSNNHRDSGSSSTRSASGHTQQTAREHETTRLFSDSHRSSRRALESQPSLKDALINTIKENVALKPVMQAWLETEFTGVELTRIVNNIQHLAWLHRHRVVIGLPKKGLGLEDVFVAPKPAHFALMADKCLLLAKTSSFGLGWFAILVDAVNCFDAMCQDEANYEKHVLTTQPTDNQMEQDRHFLRLALLAKSNDFYNTMIAHSETVEEKADLFLQHADAIILSHHKDLIEKLIIRFKPENRVGDETAIMLKALSAAALKGDSTLFSRLVTSFNLNLDDLPKADLFGYACRSGNLKFALQLQDTWSQHDMATFNNTHYHTRFMHAAIASDNIDIVIFVCEWMISNLVNADSAFKADFDNDDDKIIATIAQLNLEKDDIISHFISAIPDNLRITLIRRAAQECSPTVFNSLSDPDILYKITESFKPIMRNPYLLIKQAEISSKGLQGQGSYHYCLNDLRAFALQARLLNAENPRAEVANNAINNFNPFKQLTRSHELHGLLDEINTESALRYFAKLNPGLLSDTEVQTKIDHCPHATDELPAAPLTNALRELKNRY